MAAGQVWTPGVSPAFYIRHDVVGEYVEVSESGVVMEVVEFTATMPCRWVAGGYDATPFMHVCLIWQVRRDALLTFIWQVRRDALLALYGRYDVTPC